MLNVRKEKQIDSDKDFQGPNKKLLKALKEEVEILHNDKKFSPVLRDDNNTGEDVKFLVDFAFSRSATEKRTKGKVKQEKVIDTEIFLGDGGVSMGEKPHLFERKKQKRISKTAESLNLDDNGVDLSLVKFDYDAEENLRDLKNVAMNAGLVEPKNKKEKKKRRMVDIESKVIDSSINMQTISDSSEGMKLITVFKSEIKSEDEVDVLCVESNDTKLNMNVKHLGQDDVETFGYISPSEIADCKSFSKKCKDLTKRLIDFDELESTIESKTYKIDLQSVGDTVVKSEVTMRDEDRIAESHNTLFARKSNMKQAVEQLVEFRCYRTLCPKFWRKICLRLKEQGKKFSTGRFSEEEDEQLRTNWKRLIKNCPFEHPQTLLFRELCSYRRRDVLRYFRQTNFFIKLGKHLNRSLYAVYCRAKKLFHPATNIGRFTPEDTEILKQMVRKHGFRWERIGKLMDRRGVSLFTHFSWTKSNFAKGKWTKKEDRQLIAAVKSKVLDCIDSKDAFLSFPWNEIAKKVPTRNRLQCRLRWIEVLAFGKTGKQKFSTKYKIRLIEEIMKMNVNHESEIDWIQLASKFNVPSPQFLMNRFGFLRREIPDYHKYSLNDKLEYLMKKLLRRKISKVSNQHLSSQNQALRLET